jgi:hypothetical protein
MVAVDGGNCKNWERNAASRRINQEGGGDEKKMDTFVMAA